MITTIRNIALSILLLFFMSCTNDNDSSANAAFSDTGKGGSLARFALSGEHLYVVDNSDLNVFSLINQEDPVQVNRVNIGFDIETIFPYNNYLYIGSRNGMFIYSIETPENPTYLSEVQHFTACDPVVANGTHAFVTLHSNVICGNDINVLEIYDVTDTTSPIFLTRRNLIRPIGLGLYGDFLFVCDDDVKIFDISEPFSPVLINSIDKNTFDVIIDNDHLILIGENGLFQYRLNPNDITNIDFLSSIDI